MEYYEKIKKLRTQNKKTQEEIAKYLNTHQSYYAKYEKGKRPIPTDRLKQLCIYYGVSADWLLGIDNPEEQREPLQGEEDTRG